MASINLGMVLGLAGAVSGTLMAALAFAMSRAPGWAELRSFALVALTAALYCFFSLVHVAGMSDDAVLVGDRIVIAASVAYGLAWIRHLAISAGRSLGRLERGVIVVGAVTIVLAAVPDLLIVPPVRLLTVEWFGASYRTASDTTAGIVCIMFLMTAVLVAAFGRGRRWRDGWHVRLPMIGATALALTGIVDTLAWMQVISMPQLVEAVTVAVVGVLGVSYTRRFVADAGRLEALSTRLEHEVAHRTSELMKAQALVAHHEKLAGLGRIAAGVAHEINNPIAVIQLNLDQICAELVERDVLVANVAARLDRSRAAAERVAAIVRQLLATSRQPAPLDAITTAFAVAPVVDAAIAAAAATTGPLEVTVSIDATLCARGTPSMLEPVLINLLVNAAHAAANVPGGGRVMITGIRDGERVRLSVSDNGSGISPEVADRLFEPFMTTKEIGQGTGLGLAVSRGLMTRQGGTLDLATTSREGTEMAIELPVAESPDPITALAVELGPTTFDQHSGVHVLVIDDNDDLREVLTLQLDRYYRIDDAATVEQALAKVADGQRYDVVLCDLMMPSGGAEAWLSSCVSVDPRLAERTILVTGGPTTDTSRALVRARREKVVFKPVEISNLRPLIDRIAGL